MTIGGYDVFRIAIVCVLGVCIIVGGFKLWHWYGVDRPLNEAIAAIKGVVDHEFSVDGDLSLSLSIADDVDVSAVVRQVEQALEHHGSTASISIVDERTPELVSALQEIRFPLQEALMTGEFTLMMHRIAWILDDRDISWQLDIDDRFLYVKLAAETGVLYELIPRPVPGGSAS